MRVFGRNRTLIAPRDHSDFAVGVSPGRTLRLWAKASDPVTVLLTDTENYRLFIDEQPFRSLLRHEGVNRVDPVTIRFSDGGTWHLVFGNPSTSIVTVWWDFS